MVTQYLDSPARALYLWEDPEPVCLVGYGGPTPNHIYQTIGYRPVSDVDVYRFG